jgi:hypothetical protein
VGSHDNAVTKLQVLELIGLKKGIVRHTPASGLETSAQTL